MSLVRIELQSGKDETYWHNISQIIHEAMVSCAGVPANDRFQVITEHTPSNFIFDPDYLGIHRTSDLIIIQIFWNKGRTTDQKRSLYKTIADGLSATLQLRPEDVFINLVEVEKENWSFGNGAAQYAN